MLIFLNAGPANKAFAFLEGKMHALFSPTELETYHHMGPFVSRVKSRMHDIAMIVFCLPDCSCLTQIEFLKEPPCEPALVFILAPQTTWEERQLYKFYPRMVLRIRENDFFAVDYIRTKFASFTNR